jgi:hypothetical protein
MDMPAYPGEGLSPSQLIFALNEELKRVAYSPSYVADFVHAADHTNRHFWDSFTLDTISQFDQDTSTALATIREWRNSFISINRVPLDVLSLIPAHLSSNRDVFCASFVCRHWRRTFIQHAALWSRLYLTMTKGRPLRENPPGAFERVCTLYIIAVRDSTSDPSVPRPGTAFSSCSTNRKLDFIYNHWTDIQEFSNVVSGPLPLLRTLKMNVIYES